MARHGSDSPAARAGAVEAPLGPGGRMPVPATAVRPSTPAASDRGLVERILAGDSSAFADLVERYGAPLLRASRALLGDRWAAEEVVQDTWIGILEGLPGFEGRSSLRTWMFRILSNRARTRMARDGRSVPFSALQPADEDAMERGRFDGDGRWADPPLRWDEELPDEAALRGELRAALEAAISELPAAQRTVLTLRDVEGLESEEICGVLDITASNQRVLLHRARTRVRAALERHFRGA